MTSSILPAVFILVFLSGATAQLSKNFYSKSCPGVFDAVKPVLQSAISKEKRIGASLIRLFFHDCFVQGCDGSILLDDTGNFIGEKTARPNNNSVRGFSVIDRIKSRVEKVCPGVVSCADILTIAARDSTVILGGPSWRVKLGRRDSRTANITAANSDLPPGSANLTTLVRSFRSKGLSTKDMVALSGSHTLGQARCVTFRARIYNQTNIDPPLASNSGNNNLAPLDVQTPNVFDNNYFKNLIDQKGLLNSDQVLFNGGSTDSLVRKYVRNPKAFDSDFAKAMIKMGNIALLTGSQGEIRKNCRRVN
ncbi:unnamed protein product [Spirodela intermedia]|uniref:Peroxidase n=1 Tax=Spirodela intermedia TaxID=51605 RepID=A0A7I8IGM8_SPIIN|nr:unnamed protein product [Spirodela intermedia]CAA6656941.1 unnamed protein product [Spirodela intermedia]